MSETTLQERIAAAFDTATRDGYLTAKGNAAAWRGAQAAWWRHCEREHHPFILVRERRVTAAVSLDTDSVRYAPTVLDRRASIFSPADREAQFRVIRPHLRGWAFHGEHVRADIATIPAAHRIARFLLWQVQTALARPHEAMP